MAHDAFISHSSKDKTIADAICATLEGKNIRCWIAPRDVPPGTHYGSALNNAIRTSRVFVLLLSKGSNASDQVIRELEIAADNGIPIIPIRIENFEPTDAMRYYVKSLHWLDAMTPPIERHLKKLTTSVQALLSIDAEGKIPPVVETIIEAPLNKHPPLPVWASILLGLAAVLILGGAWYIVKRTGLNSSVPESITTPAETPTGAEPTLVPAMDTSQAPTNEETASTHKLEWVHNPATGHYYTSTGTGLSWEMLETLAVETGGHLVTINDAAEEEWLYSTFGSFMFWIGLTDYPDEGEYRWTSGESLDYINWCPGEPSDTAGSSGSEDGVHAIPWAQCWNDEPVWVTEFWDADNEKDIPSYPGVIEIENAPFSDSGSDWRQVSFLFPSPQIWDVSVDNQYTAIDQRDSDVYAWSTENYQGDIIVSLKLRSAVEALDLNWEEMQRQIPSQNSGCVIMYGDGTIQSIGSLVFCVDWDGYFIDKHYRTYDDEFLAYILHDNPSEKTYSVTIEIINDMASMYVNGEKVLSTFFDTEEISRRGRIGLFKYWADGEITFSNIQVINTDSIND